MAKVTVGIVVAAPVADAEALFYDLDRRAAWYQGFQSVSRLQGDWPQAGASLAWDSVPAGRGRVLEIVESYEPGAGQTVTSEDDKLTGTQRVEFAAAGDGATRVTLSFAYRLKGGNFFTPIFDAFFVRRPVRLTLAGSLAKFARELT